jgi:hypothetical protein
MESGTLVILVAGVSGSTRMTKKVRRQKRSSTIGAWTKKSIWVHGRIAPFGQESSSRTSQDNVARYSIDLFAQGTHGIHCMKRD